MGPPFIAAYAVDTRNESLLHESVRQIELYRQVLQADIPTTVPYAGLWHHIVGPQSQDLGLWSTGNAWVAGGMARVLATILTAPKPARPSDTQWRTAAASNLTTWIQEILDGAVGAPLDHGLVRNYVDDTSGSGNGFGEISGSSLLAAVAYRMAILAPEEFGVVNGDASKSKYVRWADRIRKTIGGEDVNGNPHVTNAGVVTPAVDPLDWKSTTPFTTGSPEGQAFVVLLYAAWRDCVLAGKCQDAGFKSPTKTRP